MEINVHDLNYVDPEENSANTCLELNLWSPREFISLKTSERLNYYKLRRLKTRITNEEGKIKCAALFICT